jgi:hypothetical protein
MTVENAVFPPEVAAGFDLPASISGINPPIKSLCKQSFLEALRYKWIESEKAGCDLGEHAVGEWLAKHWHGWCRARWLEHIMGEIYWAEFDSAAFGTLIGRISGDRTLLDRIMDRLRCGAENLDIILWASEWKIDVEAVIDILALVDVNRSRIDPVDLFAPELL